LLTSANRQRLPSPQTTALHQVSSGLTTGSFGGSVLKFMTFLKFNTGMVPNPWLSKTTLKKYMKLHET